MILNKVLVVAIVTLSNVADRNCEKWNKQKINKLWQCRTFHKRKKHGRAEKNNSTPQNRYRLMWMDVKYEPGTVKVVAFDSNGKIAAESEIKPLEIRIKLFWKQQRTEPLVMAMQLRWKYFMKTK